MSDQGHSSDKDKVDNSARHASFLEGELGKNFGRFAEQMGFGPDDQTGALTTSKNCQPFVTWTVQTGFSDDCITGSAPGCMSLRYCVSHLLEDLPGPGILTPQERAVAERICGIDLTP